MSEIFDANSVSHSLDDAGDWQRRVCLPVSLHVQLAGVLTYFLF